jgi:hypothetical protein
VFLPNVLKCIGGRSFDLALKVSESCSKNCFFFCVLRIDSDYLMGSYYSV